MNYPKLPEPSAWIDEGSSWSKDRPAFTAEQMLAYGEAVREWAAKVCEEQARKCLRENPADPSSYVTADECAAAIREGKQ